uniref:ADP-ribosylation-like factor 6 interacting protein 6 n=1 Tax=Nothobranchius furzeri TaxID=105023 RepID=A0A8C6LS13_NOTFU
MRELAALRAASRLQCQVCQLPPTGTDRKCCIRATESAVHGVSPGFWSILVLAALVGCICCVFSWTLTYLDLQQPGVKFPPPPSLEHLRDVTDHGFNVSYGVAALNGVLALLTVIWSLS